MASSYPGSLDSFTNPAGADNLDSPDHAAQHGDVNDAVESIEAKVGTGAGTPTEGKVLRGGATAGSAQWQDRDVAYMNHGATAATVRPVGATSVKWVGSVEPTNATTADEWWDTTAGVLKSKASGSFVASGSALYVPDADAPSDALRAALGLDQMVVYDTFNRANGSIGTADSGQAWTAAVGTWNVASNRATCTTSNAVAYLDAGSAEIDARLDCQIVSPGTYVGLVFRAASPTSFLVVQFETVGGVALFKNSGGTFTSLATSGGNSRVGQFHRIGVVCSNDQIVISKDGAVVISHTLSGADQTTYGSNTLVGMRGPTNALFDNFTVRDIA